MEISRLNISYINSILRPCIISQFDSWTIKWIRKTSCRSPLSLPLPDWKSYKTGTCSEAGSKELWLIIAFLCRESGKLPLRRLMNRDTGSPNRGPKVYRKLILPWFTGQSRSCPTRVVRFWYCVHLKATLIKRLPKHWISLSPPVKPNTAGLSPS